MNPPPPKEIIQVGQIEIRFLLESADTGGSLALFESVIPVGARVPVPHFHIAYDETVYGLEGVTTFTVDGRVTEVGPGGTVFIRRGEVHGFVNCGSETVRFLAMITPALLGPAFFREVGEALSAGGPPDVKRIGEIMRRHGLQPVPPGAKT